MKNKYMIYSRISEKKFREIVKYVFVSLHSSLCKKP